MWEWWRENSEQEELRKQQREESWSFRNTENEHVTGADRSETPAEKHRQSKSEEHNDVSQE